ncbi:MAG: LysR family transcriptional regulator [Oceanospirillaceae bacterium]
MDIQFLKSLVAVVEEGSIAGAARIQMITPAAVSQRIQALEREFGCLLLSRAGHKVKPTDACNNMLPRTRRLIVESQALIGDVDGSGLTGTLRVGVISTALTGLIPQALQGIESMAPSAKVHVIPGTSIELYRAIQKNELDIAIMVLPPSIIPKSLRCRVLRSEPLMLIHHKSIKGSVSEILQNNRYIRYDPLCWGGHLANQFLQDQTIYTNPMFDLDSLEAITSLVSKSMGVSLVPSWAGLDLERSNLSATIIKEAKYHRKLILMSPYHPVRPKLVDIFVELLEEKIAS